ncbi:apolipoprotein N-acyltransferase [Gaoshiqia sp. Z1-71]|uniref:apolipoprotein N-acyltransferase n=1 Tax=Gaoshiqia hydrogeniformans TaxID=3290090 RepID=UPI003BF85F9D
MKRYQLLALSLFSAVLLSLPWLGLMPGWILLTAFIPLLIVGDQVLLKREKKKSIVFFGYAYLCFWMWNALTTWWVMHATLVGIILVVFLNAAFMATVWWLYHLMKRYVNAALSNMSLAAFWITFEYLHFNWDIEWPWLTLGNGFANHVKLIQWYEYTGVMGGTLWILATNLLIYQLYKIVVENRLNRLAGTVAPLVLLTVLPVIISVSAYNRHIEKGPVFEIVVLQPNIDPYNEKFDRISPEDQLESLLQLADSFITPSTGYVVGPETALHPLWENERTIDHPFILPFHERSVNHNNVKFVLGATTQILFYPEENKPETARKLEHNNLYYDIYNSALQIDQTRVVKSYHKSILVSGVEKMPFGKYFSFIENLIIDLGGTTGSLGRQKEPTNLIATDGLKVAPVICYESVFGAYVAKFIKKGAGLIFIITNDGWWKNTPGYRQHLSFARLRAIETRRSIARSANTGISAFINQRGDILQQTSWWVKTALRDRLHVNDELTFYVRNGDYIARISSFIATLLLLFLVVQTRLKK